MSHAEFSAGQTHGQAEVKLENAVDSAKEQATQNPDPAHDSQAHAQLVKEENTGILQQTGESIANMAQGAVDGVKNTLGMGEKK